MANQLQRLRVFVGCEGVGERSYAKWLQSILDEAGLRIFLDAQIAGGGDPLAVVEKSEKLLKKRERHGKFTHKVVFLDSDKLGEAPQRDVLIPAAAKRMGASLIYQNFDHEAFLLRHFAGCET